jgi:ribosome biogenesis GTPase
VPYPDLEPYGWNDRWATAYEAVATERSEPARVVRHDGVAVVAARPGRVDQVALGNLGGAVAVGDWVSVELETATHLLPRSSLLRRSIGDGSSEQLLAANVDIVAIVAGLDRPVKPGQVERSVALAADAGADPLVVLTKADLHADPAAVVAELAATVPGVEVVLLATKAGEGVAELLDRLRGSTVVLVGESGAGKSTLVNALLGAEVAPTGDVRAGDAKGRHTTTSRNLHLLPHGGVLIDTPGIRSVGVWTDEDTVGASFGDIDDLAEGCRFRDCAHGSEPGCAVRRAVEDGDLDQRRLDAWVAMRREAASAMLRADEHARRTAERKFGRVVKDAQRRKGRDR